MAITRYSKKTHIFYTKYLEQIRRTQHVLLVQRNKTRTSLIMLIVAIFKTNIRQQDARGFHNGMVYETSYDVWFVYLTIIFMKNFVFVRGNGSVNRQGYDHTG